MGINTKIKQSPFLKLLEYGPIILDVMPGFELNLQEVMETKKR